VQAIRDDQRAVLTVSVRTPHVEGIEDVVLSLPRVVGASGVSATVLPDIAADERSLAKISGNPEGNRRFLW
jgi:L-lactate dehydrogenase